MTDRYKHIRTRDGYDGTLATGMFWEFFPELSGIWKEDKLIIEAYYDKRSNSNV